MKPTVVHEDDYGSMIDYPEDDYLEVRWYDGSSTLTTETLSQRQAVIADVVEQCGRSGMLVDTLQLVMNPGEIDDEWRDANVTPRFNAAGVRKLALLVPAAVPLVGAAPIHQGPAQYLAASFATRADARAWLQP